MFKIQIRYFEGLNIIIISSRNIIIIFYDCGETTKILLSVEIRRTRFVILFILLMIFDLVIYTIFSVIRISISISFWSLLFRKNPLCPWVTSCAETNQRVYYILCSQKEKNRMRRRTVISIPRKQVKHKRSTNHCKNLNSKVQSVRPGISSSLNLLYSVYLIGSLFNITSSESYFRRPIKLIEQINYY